VAIGVGVVTLAALYRGIVSVSRTGIALGVAAVVTLLVVTCAAFAHFSPHLATTLAPGDTFAGGLRAGLGQALVIAMYDYLGYGTANNLGDEVIAPSTTLPRAIVISIVLVAGLYVTMQAGVLGAMPWQTFVPLADGSLPPLGQHLASAIVEQAFGKPAATVATLLVLVTAFASTYGGLLGVSRIPFAAAVDGNFLARFAHVHGRLRFPDFSLAVMGGLALAGCLFSLDQLINGLTAAGTLIASIAQIAALFAMRAQGVRAPYRMWLYPLPALLALAGWVYVFCSSGPAAMLYGVATLAAGAVVFAMWRRAAR
jgi:amino acid transporter